MTLRVCADGLGALCALPLLQDGSTVPIEAERDGSYLVLTAPTAGTLLLSASGSGTLLPWVLAAAAAAVLLALLFPPPQTEKNKRSCLCFRPKTAPRGKSHGALFHATAAEEGCRR